MPLDLLLGTATRDAPDKTALVFRDEPTTYRALAEASERSARGLLACGIGKGDRIAILMGNRAEFIELYLACFRIGAIAVPLNHRFQTAEVLFAVTHCGARLLIADGPLLPVVRDIERDAPSLTGVYVYGDAPAHAQHLWDGVMRDAPEPRTWPTVADADPAMILYTSGSTGKPKGVTHTHGSILSTAISRRASQELTAADVSLAATAICHIGGSIGASFPTLLAGGTVVILEESTPDLFLDAVVKHRPTRALLLPTQLLDAVHAPRAADVDFGCFREIECGGDQISPELYARFADVAGLELNQLYGLTECEGACINPPFGVIQRGSIGVPREGVEVRLVLDGHEVPDGETGEILIRSRSVMTGYWDDPENTAAAFQGAWLRTGDLGRRDPDGYLHFEGRIKEIIIKGGSNIAPGEVEDVLDAHPDVELCGVVGFPDPRLGALVHAFVEFERDAARPPTADELAAFAGERLAAYKVPDRWTFVDELPRNAVGKIDRHSLHVQAAALDGA